MLTTVFLKRSLIITFVASFLSIFLGAYNVALAGAAKAQGYFITGLFLLVCGIVLTIMYSKRD